VRLLLGGLATAAGVLIVVVMIAVMQTATGMYDRHAADGTAATISLGIGTFGALAGGAVVIIGALVAMASEPDEMGRRWLSTWTESWR
jgi:hypothetical protein